ncbi:apolipoprotein L3-like [Haliotis rufescens]|uniref:apolipoprotein L3-like n=1 Tax=Haliotis rufescens TaxID=6454 RepID=UPI00201ED976|nr:apolipoprotein L3-like [Haliotis rufescens]
MAEMDIASFSSEVNSCSKLQKELATELRDFAENLKSKQRKVDIAKLTSSNAGLVGGGLAIAGLALAPVTAGVSLGLTIAGGVVGGGGAVSGISSMIVNYRITKNAEKHLSQKLHDYAEMSEDINTKLNKLIKTLQEPERIILQGHIEKSNFINMNTKKDIIGMIRNANKKSLPLALAGKGKTVFKSIDVVVDSVIKAVRISKATKRAVDVVGGIAAGAEMSSRVASAGKSVGTAAEAGTEVTSAAGRAATAGKVAASGVKVGGVVLAAAGVAVDLGSIIYYSRKIHKNEPSKNVENILKVADCLDDKE